MSILNLTAEPTTLLAPSGETHRIEPSGYVARVEYERRKAEGSPYCHWLCPDDDKGYYATIYIVEETPREIVFSCTEDRGGNIPSDFIATVAAKNKGLLLVTREVAEAAAYLRRVTCGRNDCADTMHQQHHPLAARMVWADTPVTEFRLREPWMEYGEDVVVGYRSLRRVPGVGR